MLGLSPLNMKINYFSFSVISFNRYHHHHHHHHQHHHQLTSNSSLDDLWPTLGGLAA